MYRPLRLFFFFSIMLLFSCGMFKIECDACEGKGNVKCTYCYGEGKERDTRCFGSGKINCMNCGGTAQKHKSIYVANNYKDGFQNVITPEFSGYTMVVGGSINVMVKCRDCDNGKIKCSNFNCQDGKVECTNCRGEGNIQCSKCNGAGEI